MRKIIVAFIFLCLFSMIFCYFNEDYAIVKYRILEYQGKYSKKYKIQRYTKKFCFFGDFVWKDVEFEYLGICDVQYTTEIDSKSDAFRLLNSLTGNVKPTEYKVIYQN